MTIPADLFRNTNTPAHWQAFADALAAELSAVDPGLLRSSKPEGMEEKEWKEKRKEGTAPLRGIVSQIGAAQWPDDRGLFTWGRQDTGTLLALCDSGVLDWRVVFVAKARYGTADDIARIVDAAGDVSLQVNRALQKAAKPEKILDGMAFEGNLDTVNALFDAGANPAYDDSSLFMTVAGTGKPEIARAFARRAHLSSLNIESCMKYALRNGNLRAYGVLRGLHWEYGRYAAVDHHTLVEDKPLPDNQTLRYVFNFASRTVTELHMASGTKEMQRRDMSFDDCAPLMIKLAHDKLVELGGKPESDSAIVDPKRRLNPAVLPLPQTGGLNKASPNGGLKAK